MANLASNLDGLIFHERPVQQGIRPRRTPRGANPTGSATPNTVGGGQSRILRRMAAKIIRQAFPEGSSEEIRKNRRMPKLLIIIYRYPSLI